MQDIESNAIQTYQTNMVYFQEKHPLLYNKLLALDAILNDGTYPQKYNLEYKQNYFDAVNLKSNENLYNQNSLAYSKKLSDNVSLQKNIQSFKSQRKLVFDEDTLNYFKTANSYTNFVSIAHLLNYHNVHSDDSMSMNKIDKYIFLGVGLGLHIDMIVNKFEIPISLIIEDDIELFRLSMFTTNYKNIFLNRTAIFCIALNKDEFHQSFNSFFLKAFFKNYFIKYSLFSTYYEQKIEDIRALLISRPEAVYSNERLLVKNKRVLEKIKGGYKFLDLQKKESSDFFKNKPWLVLGAGPSLHKNIEWLKQNHDKFIIVAAFVSLKTLKNAGISPDIAVQIDESDTSPIKMLESLGDTDFMKDTLFIFSASVTKLFFEKFDKDKIYLHEDRTKYKIEKSTLAVTSVGETIYSIALIFNPASVYLLGLDLALGDDGKTHSDDHFKSKKLENTVNENDDFQLSDNIIYVKGNFKDAVKTLPILALSIPVFNYKTAQYKTSEQTIYNLSENGAYLNDTIALRPSDIGKIKSLNKETLTEDIANIFDNYSSEKLDELETKEVLVRVSQISELKELLNTFKTSPISNDDIFLRSFENFVSAVFNNSYHSELWEILTIYFLRIGSHIDDFVSTPEIKNKKKHVKKLKQFLITQVEKIILTYEEDLNILKLTEVV